MYSYILNLCNYLFVNIYQYLVTHERSQNETKEKGFLDKINNLEQEVSFKIT